METPLPPQHDAMRETCLGLPLVEERPLSEDERVTLKSEAKRAFGLACAWGCASPFVFLFVVILCGSLFPDDNSPSSLLIFLGAIAMTLAFALAAAFILFANDRYKFRKTNKQDLRNGHLKRYHGFAPGLDIPETEVSPAPMSKIADVEFALFEPITLEVFSGSRRLWRVNGTPVKKLLLLPEERTAPLPELAQTTAKWVEPARVVAANTLDISQSGRRDLSQEEQGELRRRARTVWRKPAAGAFLFTAYFGGFAIAQWMAKASLHLEWSAYILIALTLWIDANFAKIAWWAWRLSRDATDGMVIITRFPDQMQGEEIARKGPVIEWLPHSKSNWSINGDPAPWRLRR